MGKAMAMVILGPAAVAAWVGMQRFSPPVAPDIAPVVLASLGAIAICAPVGIRTLNLLIGSSTQRPASALDVPHC